MFLYVALSVLLCISFSNGFSTTRLYPNEITEAPEPVSSSGYPAVNPFPKIAEVSEPDDDSGFPTDNPLPGKVETSESEDDSGAPTDNPLPEKVETSESEDDSSVPTDNPLQEKPKPRENSSVPTEKPLPEKAETSEPEKVSSVPTEKPLPQKAETSEPEKVSSVPTEKPLPEKAETSEPEKVSSVPTEKPPTEQTETSEPVTTSEAAATTTTPFAETPEPINFIIEKSHNKCSRTGTAGDVMEIGCWGYKECVKGEVVTYWCPNGTTFSRDSFTCVRSGSESSDCTTSVSCVGKKNGLYANENSSCNSFVACQYGASSKPLLCPGTLIFNEEISNCDWKYNVAPPCGTKVLQK